MDKKHITDLIQKLRPQITAALEEVARKNGLESLRAGNVSYSIGGSFMFKLEGIIAGGLNKDQQAYAENCKWMRLPPLGTTMTLNRTAYKTDGLNSTGSKVIMLRLDDGKRYLFKTGDVQRIAERAGLVPLPEVELIKQENR